MDINDINIKNGWIDAIRQLAAMLPDPAALNSLTVLADPNTATTLQIAEKVNEIIGALKDVI